MRNRQFVSLGNTRGFQFAPKIEYKLAAESANSADKLREANQNRLIFPFWCPEEESNPHYKFRKLTFYPLNYRGEAKILSVAIGHHESAIGHRLGFNLIAVAAHHTHHLFDHLAGSTVFTHIYMNFEIKVF